jgi:hypothetical protein
VQRTLYSLLGLMRDGPIQLQQVLGDFAEGRLVFNATVTEAPQVVRSRTRSTRLLVTAIASVGVAVLLAAPDLPSPWGISLAEPLWIALVFLYVWILIQWRRLG